MLSFAIVSAAFAVAVSAQTAGYHAINRPGMQEVVPACAPYTIVWTPSSDYSGAVTFQLIGGATQGTLVPIGDMFGNVLASERSYVWDVPCDAGSEPIYGLRIHQVSNLSIFQFSTPFQIMADGTTDSATSTISSTSAPATSLDPSPTDTNTTSSATDVTSEFSTTSAMNATVTTPTPSNPITTLTSMTTADETPTTTPDDNTVSAASTYRMTTGSFAVLAAAAAFLAL